MDAYAQQVHRYLQLMKTSALLVGEVDRANIDILLTMLGELDKDIICDYYGLFGHKLQPLDALAAKHRVQPQAITEIVARDLRKIAVTPEWQVMVGSFSPAVRQKIGVVPA